MSHWHAHVLNSRAVNRPEKVNCSNYDRNIKLSKNHISVIKIKFGRGSKIFKWDMTSILTKNRPTVTKESVSLKMHVL